MNKDGVRLALVSGVVGFGSLVFLFALFFHGRSLLEATVPRFCLETDRIESLGRRSFLLLLVRPYLKPMSLRQTNLDCLLSRLVARSMGVRDERGGLKRIEQVSPHLDGGNSDSWVSRQMAKYGKVESLGFAQDASRLVSIMETPRKLGEKTALGGVLDGALQDAPRTIPARIGRCLYGWSKQRWEAEVAKGTGFAVPVKASLGWGSSRKKEIWPFVSLTGSPMR